MSIALRPYQTAAVDRARAKVAAGNKRVLIVAPTGSGKTVIATHIVLSAVAKGRRVLFIAHRRELINQAVSKLIEAGLPAGDVGVIMGKDKRRSSGAPVQVASIDTLRNRAKPEADLVFIDEAHRALSRSHQDVARTYPNAVHIGLTATPYRADNRGLGGMYDDLVVVAATLKLIEQGFLVEPRVFTVPAAELPDLSRVRLKGSDYDESALSVVVDQSVLVGNIVEHWKKHANSARTVAFAVNVEHSKHLAGRFNAAGISAEHLDGETPELFRDAILARLERGETKVVVNCNCLAEGWDMPSVKCCILARPTKSAGLYLQQAGRILRPFEGQEAIILDHSGNAVVHGLPQEDRQVSLNDGPSRRGNGGSTTPPAKVCDSCFAVVAAAVRDCPLCGFVFPETQAMVDTKEKEANLVEVRLVTQDEKRADYDKLLAIAQSSGKKPGWAAYKYKDKYGLWPPHGWKPKEPPKFDAGDEEMLEEWQKLTQLARERGYKAGFANIRFQEKFGRRVPIEWAMAAKRTAAAPAPPPELGATPENDVDDDGSSFGDWLAEQGVA